jgi:hypothetical protein
MELQEKFDFDAVDRHGGGPILSADLEMEGQLAFGAGRKVRFDSKAVMFLVVGVLVVCGVLLGATCGGGGCGSDEGPPSAPAVPSSGEGPPSAPAVPSTNAAATTSAQRPPPPAPPMGSCSPAAPVLHSAPCPETVLDETCTVRCQQGYGDTADAHAEYRCAYHEGMQRAYNFEAVGAALRCGYNPTLPRARPPPPPPPPPGHPAGADHQCPPGCRHVTHTSSSMFPLGTGTPASDRCDCRSQHALSGNRPPPVRLLATLMFDLRCPH